MPLVKIKLDQNELKTSTATAITTTTISTMKPPVVTRPPTILIRRIVPQQQIKLQQIKQQQPQQQLQIAQQFINRPFLKIAPGTGLIINKIPSGTTIKRTSSVMKRISHDNRPALTGEPFAKSSKVVVKPTGTVTPLSSTSQWQHTIGGTNGTIITPIVQNQMRQQQPQLQQQQSQLLLQQQQLQQPKLQLQQPKMQLQQQQQQQQQQQDQIGAAINSLPANTIIQASNSSGPTIAGGENALATSTPGGEEPRSTMSTKCELKLITLGLTIEVIESNPLLQLGVAPSRLPLLKNVVCPRANLSIIDCYLTLKKLRLNENFQLLGEYFELNEIEAQDIFARTIAKLATYMRYLIRWPENVSYYNRHKYLPFAFRTNLSNVQSMLECIVTDMPRPPNASMECTQYKFILCITPTNIITFISEAYIGSLDDLAVINASNFQNLMPKYLSMIVEPGRGIRRKRKSKMNEDDAENDKSCGPDSDSNTDSAEESLDDDMSGIINCDEKYLYRQRMPYSKYATARIAGSCAADQTMHVVNGELTSTRTGDIKIPTASVREPVCRRHIRYVINAMREYRVLQPYGLTDPILFQYINEILVVTAALINIHQ